MCQKNSIEIEKMKVQNPKSPTRHQELDDSQIFLQCTLTNIPEIFSVRQKT